ncbi:MAG: class I SAM-dependent rRNA methyltransferase [Bellilinea sp.]|jgi:23S rRNA (cytosine1962-C5)-methyltransferase
MTAHSRNVPDAQIILKAGREKATLSRHPWIFSGAIERIVNNPEAGSTVGVYDHKENFLGYAAYSPVSSIRARFWTFTEDKVNEDFFFARLKTAIHYRKQLQIFKDGNAARLVYAESDGLPGVIADCYGDVIVVQLLTAGAEWWREVIFDQIQALTGCKAVVERSDVDVRKLEGLPLRSGVVRGELPTGKVQIVESNLRFWVDVLAGQKTGFYLDQRRNRQIVQRLAQGRDVLNAFCYTGGFTVYALAGGARSVYSIDSSSEAIDLGITNLMVNGIDASRSQWAEGDVFKELRAMRDRAMNYDLIVLDPPKFAPTAAQAHKAARGYKDINLLGFKLLRPGGFLVTFSCSGGISRELFQKIVADAALDAGVNARIVEILNQAPDHPVNLRFPESAYLKGLMCVVD